MTKSIADKLRDAPRLDHGAMGPSGHVSQRAQKAEVERCFGGENKITMRELQAEALASIQPSEADRLDREAARLREYAAAGMKPRAFLRQAVACEARARALREG